MLKTKRITSLVSTITFVSLIMTLSPLLLNVDNYKAFASNCDKHDHDDHEHEHEHSEDNDNENKKNESEQEISQQQSSYQNSQVVSGEDTIASGNNVGLFFNSNLGNIALGQQ